MHVPAISLFPSVTSRVAVTILKRYMQFAALVLLGLSFCLLPITEETAQAQQTRQTLRNHVQMAVTTGKASAVRAVADSEQMNLAIVLPLRNTSDLTSLIQRLYDPSSPDYHKFLSVDEFAEKFGPTESDYQAVIDFANNNGLTVTATSPNRRLVSIKGYASQINQAFHIKMGIYQHPTEDRTFYSPDQDPSLDLNVKVAQIAGLSNFYLPKPMVVKPQQANILSAATNANGSGPSGSYLASDMRAVYYGGSALTGVGQCVGLLEFGGYDKSNVDLTFSNAGETYSVPINNVLLDGASEAPQGDDGEQVLDIVQAIGMAPGLDQVRVYIGHSDASILNSMASENICKQLSISWSWRPADPSIADQYFQEFAAQGQSVFVASGDSGAYDATVSPFFYPQDDAFVTTVGGTHLTTTGPKGSWASEEVWNSQGNGSGGGISKDGIALPFWQSGVATAANGGSMTLRNVPDVAMEGDADNYSCSLGQCWTSWAGTSFAAPRWAGFMALVNQQAVAMGTAANGGVGFINPTLYTLGAGNNPSDYFHDITIGNNKTLSQSIWYSATTGYDLTTGWGTPTGQKLIDALSSSQSDGFWLSAPATTLQLGLGSTKSATITVVDSGSFTGSVDLSITSSLPAGVTATLTPSSTTGSSILTLTASSTATTGVSDLIITGVSGSITRTLKLSLSVQAPKFLLTASPSVLSINQGATGTSTITVTPQYGFSGSVSLSASGLPSGVTASWNPDQTSGSSVLTLTAASNAVAGTSTITLTGVSGSLTVTKSLSLTINGATFSLSPYDAVTMGQGSSQATSIYINRLNGFSGPVSLSASNLPSGVTASFSPNPSSSSGSTLTLSASNTATTGSSTVTVTGTSGAITTTATFNLSVFTPTFSISNPTAVDMGKSTSTNVYIPINYLYGFTGKINLSISGLPAGVTGTWSSNPTTSNASLTLLSNSSVAVGTYPITITGVSGSITQTATFNLNIHDPTFTLSSSGATIGQGSTASGYLYVNGQYGFQNSVNLSISGLPSGLTATFGSNPTTYFSNIQFAASSSVPPGQYVATITGTSGATTVTTKTTVVVNAPSFDISGPFYVSLGIGGSTTSSVYIYSNYGFNNNVTLSLSNLPSGVTATWGANPTSNNTSLVLTASNSAVAGNYTVGLTAVSGSLTRTTSFTLTIGTPTFTLNGYDQTIGQGSSSTGYVYLTSSYGFSDPVTLSASDLPSGVTATFATNPTTYSSSITFAATSSVATGIYPISITGTAGSLTKTVKINLTVAAQSFSLGNYDKTISIIPGSTATGSLYISGQNGFNKSVTLTATGLPTGVSIAFTPNPATSFADYKLTAPTSTPLGTSTVTITGTAGSLTASTTVALTVEPAFAIFTSPGVVNLAPSAGAKQTLITVAAQPGFAGAVSLDISNLPPGISATWGTNPTANSSTLTLTSDGSASVGNTTATVTATSGSMSATTPLVIAIHNTPTATSTALDILSGGKSVTTVTAETPIVLSAKATAGGAPLSIGQVKFCETGGQSCEGNRILGIAQITNAGTATLKIIPSLGSHRYSATLLGTVGNSASTTAASSLTVSGLLSSTADLTASGTASSYSLQATVSGQGLTVPTGSITFSDSTKNLSLGTATLSGDVANLSWVNPAAPSAGPSPTSILSNDFNGDGVPDLAIANSGSYGGAVSILIGNGNGTFTSSALSPQVGSSPGKMISADFNGDGIPDLFVLNNSYGSSNVATVLLGNGDGTFTASASSPTISSYPSSVTTADFNRDGIADLAISSNYYSSGPLVVLLGRGDGTFTNSGNTASAGTNTQSIVSGDLNGDGIPDLAATDSNTAGILVLLGNGDGTFSSPTKSTVGSTSLTNLVIADFNNDGKLDLAAIGAYNSSISILLGNGDGTFTATDSPSLSGSATNLTVGDFNGDHITDLAVSGSSYSAGISILLGKGDGKFTQGTNPSLTTASSGFISSDFDGDGLTDLGILSSSNYSNSSVSILSPSITHKTTAKINNISLTGLGIHQVGAIYSGDSVFKASSSPAIPLNAELGTPTVAISPSATMITTSQVLTIAVKLSGKTGDPVPTGTITIAAANYSGLQSTTTGSATFLIAPGVLPEGQSTLTITYSPDAISSSLYRTANQTISINVVKQTTGTGVASVTISPISQSITRQQSAKLTISVTGASGTPTGSITLSGGNYNTTQSLTNGSAVFTVAGESLSEGMNTLTAAYSGDAIYTPTTATANVTVSALAVSTPTPSPVSAGAPVTNTVTFSAGTAYTGTMNLTCTLLSSPSGAQNLPTCSLNPSTITLVAGGTGAATLTVKTTGSATASLNRPSKWNSLGLGSTGSILAAFLVFGFSGSRRRIWTSMVLLLCSVIVMGAIGCGGGGGGGSTTQPTTPTTPQTTSGSYVFSVTGTDTMNPNLTTSTTVTITVK